MTVSGLQSGTAFSDNTVLLWQRGRNWETRFRIAYVQSTWVLPQQSLLPSTVQNINDSETYWLILAKPGRIKKQVLSSGAPVLQWKVGQTRKRMTLTYRFRQRGLWEKLKFAYNKIWYGTCEMGWMCSAIIDETVEYKEKRRQNVNRKKKESIPRDVFCYKLEEREINVD